MGSPFKLITLDLTGVIVRFKIPPIQNYLETAIKYKVIKPPPLSHSYDPNCINNYRKDDSLSLERKKLMQEFNRSWSSMNRQYPHFGQGCGGLSSSKEWWHALVVRTFSHLKKSNTLIDVMFEDLYDYYSRSEAYVVDDSGVSLLKTVKLVKHKNPGMKSGVITNNDERIVKILNELDLDQYFDFICTSEFAKSSKPDVQIFRVAERMAGFTNSDLDEDEAMRERNTYLHIGDSIEMDYNGAFEADWTGYLLNTKTVKPNPDLHIPNPYVFYSYGELMDHLIPLSY